MWLAGTVHAIMRLITAWREVDRNEFAEAERDRVKIIEAERERYGVRNKGGEIKRVLENIATEIKEEKELKTKKKAFF